MIKAFKKQYLYLTISIFLIYVILNILLSGFYETIPLILTYAKTVNWIKLSISIFLSLVIGILIAINTTYIYILYRQRKQCTSGATATSLGTIGGLITGVCPLCVTGLFPIVFGLFGISFSLASLPFQGIEVQLAIVILLIVSYKMLNKNNRNI